jgi:hypothetical protein
MGKFLEKQWLGKHERWWEVNSKIGPRDIL